MPRLIASCGVAERDRRAAPINLAAAAGIDAGEQLDEGRFAGAVFADDGVNLALFEAEIHRFERVRRAEMLIEFGQAEQRRARRAAVVFVG